MTLVEPAIAAMESAMLGVFPALLLATHDAGGAATANAGLRVKMRAAAPDPPPVKFSFAKNQPEARDWAAEHAAELVKGVSKTTRDEIKAAIAASFDDDADMADVMSRIGGALGDDDRATLVARTESIRAANAGQQSAWKQAVQNGLLDGSEQQVWIVTPDDKLCPICEALDGTVADLDGGWDADGDYVDGPPAHPNCRCALGLVLDPLETLRAAWPNKDGYDDHGHGPKTGPVEGGAKKPASKYTKDQIRAAWPDKDGNDDHGRGQTAIADLGRVHGSDIPTSAVFKGPKSNEDQLADVHGALGYYQDAPSTVQSVRLSRLEPTQDEVGLRGLHLINDGRGHDDRLPDVIYHAGRYYIADGHHRLAVQTLRGKTEAQVNLYRLKDIPTTLRAAWPDKTGFDDHGRGPNFAEHQAAAEKQTSPLAKAVVLGWPNSENKAERLKFRGRSLEFEGHAYVAAHGQEFAKVNDKDPLHASGVANECYKNASLTLLDRKDLRYAEGFLQFRHADGSASGIAILHAWNVDKQGRVVDPSPLHVDKGLKPAYFGVVYDRAKYLKYLWKAKIYGVLGSTKTNAFKAIDTNGKDLR